MFLKNIYNVIYYCIGINTRFVKMLNFQTTFFGLYEEITWFLPCRFSLYPHAFIEKVEKSKNYLLKS